MLNWFRILAFCCFEDVRNKRIAVLPYFTKVEKTLVTNGLACWTLAKLCKISFISIFLKNVFGKLLENIDADSGTMIFFCPVYIPRTSGKHSGPKYSIAQ